jgi:hypothetical protein
MITGIYFYVLETQIRPHFITPDDGEGNFQDEQNKHLV